jgi:predicted TIM-barrel fold metal-dependent hydrolase
MKRILSLALMLSIALPLAVQGQTPRNQATQAGTTRSVSNTTRQSTSNAQQATAPLVDYHTHIWSLNARTLVSEPLLPIIKLPDELARLLKDKEDWDNEKNRAALTDIYTEDTLVLDALAPTWLRGPRALKYVGDSITIFRLLPVAYEVGGSSGYIAGTEAKVEGDSVEHLSNFLYVIRKGADGKWRISAETFTANGPPVPRAATAEELIKELDAGGVKRAAVLSVAFWYGSVNRKSPEDEYAKVRAENDWVAQQVAKFPDRLVGFCSFNPLKDYALDELNRCAKIPQFKGLKLHFGNSGVDVLNPQHVEKMRRVFRAANDLRLPIVVHLWRSAKYGPEHSRSFLSQIVTAAPDIPIQIAHMAASGPNYHSDDALEVYANAAVAGDARMKNLYFDVASMVTRNTPPASLTLVAKRLHQLGLQRVLFGSDHAPGGSNDTPKDAWEAFRRLPLTEEEFRTIAGNVAPYMR